MRRNKREITDINEILAVLKRCDTCRIAFFDEKYPYIVPMSYGFSYENERLTIFLHCAKTGKKIELINKNNCVSFEVDTAISLVTGENACDYSMKFESVVGFGKIFAVEENKKDALLKIMSQYSEKTDFTFSDAHLNAVAVYKIEIDSFSGKRYV